MVPIGYMLINCDALGCREAAQAPRVQQHQYQTRHKVSWTDPSQICSITVTRRLLQLDFILADLLPSMVELWLQQAECMCVSGLKILASDAYVLLLLLPATLTFEQKILIIGKLQIC